MTIVISLISISGVMDRIHSDNMSVINSNPPGSASVRWNIHKENFLNPAEKINELALRGSYGFRGTSPATSPYLTLKNYGRNDAVYMPENTSELAEFPNANLKWEKTATVNAGIDFAFWGNRLSGAHRLCLFKKHGFVVTTSGISGERQ